MFSWLFKKPSKPAIADDNYHFRGSQQEAKEKAARFLATIDPSRIQHIKGLSADEVAEVKVMAARYRDETTSHIFEALAAPSPLMNKIRTQIENNDFWADRSKKLPFPERLALAVEHLPLPGAFRDAAISVRGIIREKHKNDVDYTRELEILYWLAAMQSFYKPYSKALKQPGFNVLETIPQSVLSSFQYDWEKLGYKHLPLLNKTDVKRLVAAWGEPKRHSSLIKDYASVWSEYEIRLLENQNLE